MEIQKRYEGRMMAAEKLPPRVADEAVRYARAAYYFEKARAAGQDPDTLAGLARAAAQLKRDVDDMARADRGADYGLWIATTKRIDEWQPDCRGGGTPPTPYRGAYDSKGAAREGPVYAEAPPNPNSSSVVSVTAADCHKFIASVAADPRIALATTRQFFVDEGYFRAWRAAQMERAKRALADTERARLQNLEAEFRPHAADDKIRRLLEVATECVRFEARIKMARLLSASAGELARLEAQSRASCSRVKDLADQFGDDDRLWIRNVLGATDAISADALAASYPAGHAATTSVPAATLPIPATPPTYAAPAPTYAAPAPSATPPTLAPPPASYTSPFSAAPPTRVASATTAAPTTPAPPIALQVLAAWASDPLGL